MNYLLRALWQRPFGTIPLSLVVLFTPLIMAAPDGESRRPMLLEERYAAVGSGEAEPAITLQLENAAISNTRYLERDTGIWLGPHNVWDIEVAGNVAYVAAAWEGLLTFDVTDPENPVLLSRLAALGGTDRVLAHGGFLYATTTAEQLAIVDATNPLAPRVVGQFPDVTFAGSGCLAGSHLYLPDNRQRVSVFDVVNPSSPHLITSIPFDTLVERPYQASASGNLLFVSVAPEYELVLFDISDPASPQRLGEILPDSADHYAFFQGAVPGCAYVYYSQHRIGVFDISTPSAPVEATVLQTAGRFNMAMVANGQLHVLGYSADAYDGYDLIYDVTNPLQPVLLDSITLTQSSIWDADIKANFILTASYDLGFRVYDLASGGGDAVAAYSQTARGLWELEVRGDYALCVGRGGLLVFDISTVSEPRLVAEASTRSWATTIECVGDYALVTAPDSGLHVFNVSDPVHPTEVSYYPRSGKTYGPAVSWPFVFVSGSTNGVEVLDLTNPAAPVPVTTIATPGPAYDARMVGGYCYVACDSAGLCVFDVTIPSSPELVTTLSLPIVIASANRHLEMGSDGYLYTTGDYGAPFGFHMIDISNPAAPHEFRNYAEALFQPVRIYPLDTLAIALSPYSGEIRLLNLADPMPMVTMEKLTSILQPMDMEMVGQYAVVATRYELAIMKVNPFVCGEIDGLHDGVDIADLSALVEYLFFGGPLHSHPNAANVDGLGGTDISDLTHYVSFLFFGGPAPVCPD